MIHYLDTCALLKLVKPERETKALRTWMKRLDEAESFVTSELAELELNRTLIRHGSSTEHTREIVESILDVVDMATISRKVLGRAVEYDIPRLGTLDSIHLATAEQFADELKSFVTYDKELLDAGRHRRLPVVAPAE